MWDKKRHFFLANIGALNLVKLCSAWKIYALQHLLVGQTIAVVCQALLSSLLAQRWVQGAKHTILLQKPKPGLHQLRDEGQQNGYTEMILSSSESGH